MKNASLENSLFQSFSTKKLDREEQSHLNGGGGHTWICGGNCLYNCWVWPLVCNWGKQLMKCDQNYQNCKQDACQEWCPYG